MTSDRIPLLVLGLGNVLCGDDGAGVEAIERMSARWVFSDEVRVLDGGTLGLSLLPYLRSADKAIFVDAVLVDEPPGTIVRFDGEQVLSIATGRMSCHQVGVADVLECARLLGDLPDVTLIGIAATNVAAMTPPTAEVGACIDDLAERVVTEIRASGYEPTPRVRDTMPSRTFAEEQLNGAGLTDSPRAALHRAGFRDRL